MLSQGMMAVNVGHFTDYSIPKGYTTQGVQVASNILQRILRGPGSGGIPAAGPRSQYKNISKRIVVTGNPTYIHIAADHRFSDRGLFLSPTVNAWEHGETAALVK